MPIHYEFDKIRGEWSPAKYPGENIDKWIIPEDIRSDFGKLNSIIESKYTREYLKVCAFYNKLFPSLKTSTWSRSSYNVQPFTVMDQERTDTGTGISSNYLKQIIDQVVSRLGTVTFEPMLIADVPTLEYIIYKDEVERLLRKAIRDVNLNRVVLEAFHDAAILGYSHVFIDPFTHKFVKANDYEIGIFEAQYSHDNIKQMLYRDYAFPVTSLIPYVAHCDEETKEKLITEYGDKNTVDFKMYFDCIEHKVYVVVGGCTLDPIVYPFDNVMMATFAWDIGFSKVMSSSLFDLLYPTQRELNKIMAKVQQLIRMYKGPVPVFNSNVDLAMKQISNGTGECLYVDSPRPIDQMMNVINPTPLDANLTAEVTNRKTEMYELAGLQQVSFDMENMRSAAAVIAVDQTRDSVFQAQMDGKGHFITELFNLRVHYDAVMDMGDVDGWSAIAQLLDNCAVQLKPVTITSPLGTKNASAEVTPPNYQQIQVHKTVLQVLRGQVTYEDLPFVVDVQLVKVIMATTMVQFDALGIAIPDTAQKFMIDAFLEDVQSGMVPLGQQ